MSQGIYGTTIPANVNPATDVEIWYNYRPTRAYDSVTTSDYTQLSPSCLVPVTRESANYLTNNILEGMYTLKLPLAQFSTKGFYSIYIKPKEYPATINDVSTLSTYNDVKGIIFQTDNLQTDSVEDNVLKNLLLINNGLVGYRVIYIKDGKRLPDVRIVTSNNRAEPMVQTTGSNSTVYQYNDTSTTVFVTLTPSTAPSFKPNALPYIGTSGQQVLFVNTKFEPIHLDIEMVENDADTVATMISGNQLRSLDEGLITTFNNNNEIFIQQEIYTLKDKMTGKPIYEIRKLRDTIDFTQELPS